MNTIRQTSTLLAAVWVCGICLPNSAADAHGNNPKTGIEDETKNPQQPPAQDPDPPTHALLDFRRLEAVLVALPVPREGLSDATTELDDRFLDDVQMLANGAIGPHALFGPMGRGPHAGPPTFTLRDVKPEFDFTAQSAPGLPGANPLGGGVPAPGTLAILGLAAAIAGRRRRRQT